MPKTEKNKKTKIVKTSEGNTTPVTTAALADTDSGKNGILNYLLQFKLSSKIVHKIVRKDGAIGIPVKLRADLGWEYRTEVDLIELGNGRLLIQKHVSTCKCCGKPVLSKDDLSGALGVCINCDSELLYCIATGKLPNGEPITTEYEERNGSKIDFYYAELCNYKAAANEPSGSKESDKPKPGVRRVRK